MATVIKNQITTHLAVLNQIKLLISKFFKAPLLILKIQNHFIFLHLTMQTLNSNVHITI